MIEFPKQTVDIVIEGAYLILRPCPVLYLVYLFDDVRGDLLAPSLTFIEVVYLTNVPQTTGTFIVLPVHESTFHRPPTIEHTLSLLAISSHLKEN
jgi:hypothetical protein